MKSLSSINRRRTLAVLGGAGFAAMLGDAACVPATPQVTEGPYWVDEKLFRSDIRTDPATGLARAGVPLSLTITVQNETGCVPLTGALVDIWHCDAIGIYSDESTYNPGGGTGSVNTSGQKFLRGYQISDSNGQVQFTTIYPGWYSGRTIHIHVRVRTYSGSTLLTDFVTQVFFDDTASNAILAQAPYNTRTSARDTTNANDNVYSGAQSAARMLATLTPASSGYSAAITIGGTFQAITTSSPSIVAAGIVNAASGAAGVAPVAWISIYGTNLAPSAYGVAASDIVANFLPATLNGVTVQIDGKAAYLHYVSPAQINVLAPADSNRGSVVVTVVNANGTGTATVNLQTYLPGLFTTPGNYVRAVRASDGYIINGTGAVEDGYATAAAARAGDVLEIWGTGFGPTSTTVSPGLVFSGAYVTSSPVTVTIGGIDAPVSWAGLTGAGLYQVNLTVPGGLADGDHTIVASVGGYSSATTALLKTSSS